MNRSFCWILVFLSTNSKFPGYCNPYLTRLYTVCWFCIHLRPLQTFQMPPLCREHTLRYLSFGIRYLEINKLMIISPSSIYIYVCVSIYMSVKNNKCITKVVSFCHRPVNSAPDGCWQQEALGWNCLKGMWVVFLQLFGLQTKLPWHSVSTLQSPSFIVHFSSSEQHPLL